MTVVELLLAELKKALERYEDETYNRPVGCDLIVDGQSYTWNGEKMVKLVPEQTDAPKS